MDIVAEWERIRKGVKKMCRTHNKIGAAVLLS